MNRRTERQGPPPGQAPRESATPLPLPIHIPGDVDFVPYGVDTYATFDMGDLEDWRARIERLAEIGHGWTSVYLWGGDGWDLGAARLVGVAHHTPDEALGQSLWAVATWCEGDIYVSVHRSRQERDADTDAVALFMWHQFGNGPKNLPLRDRADLLDPAHRGPYRP